MVISEKNLTFVVETNNYKSYRMRLNLLTLLLLMASMTLSAQPRYKLDNMVTEKLDRGVVAVRQSDGRVFLSWRILRSDREGEPFNIYRNGTKLNAEPLTTGGSWFIDADAPTGQDLHYDVCGGTIDGSFTLSADSTADYLTIPIQKPDDGDVPVMAGSRNSSRYGRWRDNGHYSYTANDATVADVDGDGRYEIILKWDPSNSHDNAHDGYTGPTFLDCHSLDGTRLWRINLGQNIRSGAHYTPFIVYDLDGDGCAELLVKTAPGTRDGLGRLILDTSVASGSPADTIPDYRNPRGRILEGPEYLTVFKGLTGEAMDTKPYIPERGSVSDWGDDRGNRSERYLAAVGYLGAQTPSHQLKPSAIFCRGYYTRTVIAAWDWDGHQLTQRWTFDTNEPEWRRYAGQGNHNLRIADVDGDGLDEITYGSMAIDHDGRGLYNTRMGHGDAIHLVADPHDGRLYIWDCHENRRDGTELRDAATGKVIFQIKSPADVGRAMAADIDPTNPGCELWSIDSHGVWNMKGECIYPAPPRLSINFGIWWDGDLLRELLDHERITKYNYQKTSIDTIKELDGKFNNGTKSNPCLSADILGDWREEVILRNRESTELRIYTTTIPTPYRINCLMQDVPYRLSVACQNVGYNQPPETGFYLGEK